MACCCLPDCNFSPSEVFKVTGWDRNRTLLATRLLLDFQISIAYQINCYFNVLSLSLLRRFSASRISHCYAFLFQNLFPNVFLSMASIYINMIYVPELAHYIFNSPSLLPEVLQKPPDWSQHNWPLGYLNHLASRGVFLKYTSSHIVIPLFRISPCFSAFLTRALGKFAGLEPRMH